MITRYQLLTLALCTSSMVYAETTTPTAQKIVYGKDNRMEVFEGSAFERRIAKSTAGMIESAKLINVGHYSMLPPKSISDDMGLCSYERFASQPNAVTCSGFLVAPDILVTAGHCVANQASCDSISWIFDYKLNEKTKRADMLVHNSNIFKCSKILDHKLEGKGLFIRDYAVIKLNRKAHGRNPLKIRTKGEVKSNVSLTVIGHPSGLPSKITSKGIIVDNSFISYFKTNLDTFGGNSGSAVFDSKTGVVEGILVRGVTDYNLVDSCYEVNTVPQSAGKDRRYGESVSRITDVDFLSSVKD